MIQPLITEPWQHARLFHAAVRETGHRFIVAQICLGWELHNLKQSLGFSHGGARKVSSGQCDHLKTWPEWVADELDISRETADRFIRVFHGFQAKLSNKLAAKILPESTSTSADEILHALASPPEELTAKERATVMKSISLASDGDTQAALLRELKLVKAPATLAGGNTSKSNQPEDEDGDHEPLAQQLALNLFGTIAKGLQSSRTGPDYKAFLYALPVEPTATSDVCLTALKLELETSLADIKDAIKAKTQSP